jgi:hypothetical protein
MYSIPALNVSLSWWNISFIVGSLGSDASENLAFAAALGFPLGAPYSICICILSSALALHALLLQLEIGMLVESRKTAAIPRFLVPEVGWF